MKARKKSKQTAVAAAARLLSRRRYFAHELRTRLLRRFSRAEAEAAIKRMGDLGYLNDADTSLTAVEEWVLKRGRGVAWVEVLLETFQLPEEVKSAAKVRAEELEYEGARGVARRLLKLNKTVKDIRTSLYRRGFRRETVETLLSSIGGVIRNGNTQHNESDDMEFYRDRGNYRGRHRRGPHHQEEGTTAIGGGDSASE
ncbi:MAG: hypothetical protein V2G42_02740 [bacterium JZ-2024 1]